MMRPRSRSSSRLGAYVQLIRPLNSVMMGIAVVIGEVAVLGGIPTASQIVMGFLVSFFLTAASMVLNDYIDLEIDRINSPERPLPSGLVSCRSAFYLAVALSAAGLAAAVPFSYYGLTIAALTLSASVVYNLYAKKTGLVGNAVVAFCIAVPFLFGGVVVTGAMDITVLTFFLLAFLSNVGREMTKGIADIEGDRTRMIKTVAITRGTGVAAAAAAFFYLVAVSLSPLPYLFGEVGIAYVPLVIVTDAGFAYSSIKILRDQSKGTALRVKNEARLWMITALMAFFFGGLMR